MYKEKERNEEYADEILVHFWAGVEVQGGKLTEEMKFKCGFGGYYNVNFFVFL